MFAYHRLVTLEITLWTNSYYIIISILSYFILYCYSKSNLPVRPVPYSYRTYSYLFGVVVEEWLETYWALVQAKSS